MVESMPRAGTRVFLAALAAAAIASGCAAGEGPAGAAAFGGAVENAQAAVPPPDPLPFQCAGFTSAACPGGKGDEPTYLCADDWRDDCDPQGGGADCPGLCVGEAVQHCGGPADPPCGAGEVCVADPSLPCAPPSDAEPACSLGVCVRAACDPDQPCGDADTCVGGLLYPTTCGPNNCDAPIGPCGPWDECGPPPPCPAPPLECHYEGGGCAGGQWSCGELVCDELPPSPDSASTPLSRKDRR
ncbi:MAG TPA: hypothetical protein VFS43_32805 [Polyangiaceae bacterium]|nr:hypothetical protein [Polyangiaceae bacterium]